MKAERPVRAAIPRSPRCSYTSRLLFQWVSATVSQPESSDTHFFNSFSVVLGILIAFAICLFAFARLLGREQNVEELQDPLVLHAAQQNTAPFSKEAIAGQDNSALAISATPPAGAAAAVPTTGED